MGRLAVLLLSSCVAAPAAAQVPAKLVSTDFALVGSRAGATPVDRAEPSGSGYPRDLPRIPTDDALRPPDLLWSPTPSSLVRVMPSKVRYKLKF